MPNKEMQKEPRLKSIPNTAKNFIESFQYYVSTSSNPSLWVPL